MAKQIHPPRFSGTLPNTLLARYFQEKHGVLQEIEFDKLKENEVESVFQAVMVLPKDKIAALELNASILMRWLARVDGID